MKVLILTLAIFILAACNTENIIDLNVDQETQHIELRLNNTNAELPDTFKVSPQIGSVFFETKDGRKWIKGNPEVVQNKNSAFIAIWSIDGRDITVSFSRKKEKIDFSFEARPNADILKWGFNIKAANDEFFTGLFERVVDGDQGKSWKKGITQAMDLRGQSVDMFIKPTLSLYCPFYLSSKGYGLFISGTWPGHYDFCKKMPEYVQIEFEGPELSGTIYTSSNPADIVKTHSLNVGPTIVPPKWAFMPYRWRDNHTNLNKYYDGTPVNAPFNSMLVEDILMMEAFDIPCGVYWIDRPWAKNKTDLDIWLQGYEDFEWNEEQIPHPQEMIKWLDSKNINLLLWMAPWITGDWVAEANEKNYVAAQKSIDTSKLVLIDFTNPDAVEWWQENGPAKVLKDGVKGFKLDRAEEIVQDKGDFKYSNGKTAREMHNAYPVSYVKAANEVCRKYRDDDFLLFPRAGYTGSSKYSAFWGGDHASTQEALRCAIIGAQRAAVIGFPLWGSDIGGYWQGDMDREIIARWLAFGCFNPIMEFGPTQDQAPWNMKQEPYYDTTLIATWRLYAKVHANLVEYTYALAKKANSYGMPVIRPLFLEYPKQEKAWQDWQTFKYGPDILVSAIWKKGTTSDSCYLPAGTRWIDAWNKEKIYDGGQVISVETPFHKIPIFIKEDSDIDLGDLNKLFEESLLLAGNKPNLQELEKTIK